MSSEWAWWQNALNGTIGPIQEAEPQWGYYRHYIGAPVAIWGDDETPLIVLLDGEPVADPVQQGKIWIQVAKGAVSYEDYVIRTETGAWPEAVPAAPERGPGDNSGDLDAYRRMRADVLGDVAEAEAYYAKHKVRDKPAADKAMDWGDRLVRAAREADEARKRENEPLRQQIAENDKRWKTIIEPANRQGLELRDLAIVWGQEEAARLRKEAEAKAKAEWDAQQEALRKQREAAAAERARLDVSTPHDADGVVIEDVGIEFDLPSGPPPQPIVEAPKIMLGTGTHGNRRGVSASSGKREPVIVDLAAAAAFLAETRNSDLIALVLRVGGKIAKAGGQFPGVQMQEKVEETADVHEVERGRQLLGLRRRRYLHALPP